MATLGLSKVFILDKYFTELQKFWETEKKLQDASSSNEAVHLQRRLLSLSSELVTLRNHLHVGGAPPAALPPAPGPASAPPQPAVPPRAPHLLPPQHHSLPPAPEPRWRSAPAPTTPAALPAPLPAPLPTPLSAPLPTDVDDLIHLRGPLTEDAVVRALQARFYHNKFYTMIGPIVVALNPYTDTCNALTLTAARAQRPELARLVSDAVRHQADTGYPQAIILSGVSGSGKTYASMVLLRRLFDVAGGGPETDAFKHLAAAFTVLRALGTAATPANSSSSRIGHFIEVQVTDGALYRTKIHCYFLEQTRVVRPPPAERNYHIFYQLLAGLAPDERATLHLDGYSPQDLRYLASPQPRRPESEDAARFQAWKTCLVILGIPFLDVVRVLAAVLLLGNVQFAAGAEGGAEPAGEGELAAAAALLGVPAPVLLRGLATAARQLAEAARLDPRHALLGLERVGAQPGRGVAAARGGRGGGRGGRGTGPRALHGGAQRRGAARDGRLRRHPRHVRLRGRFAEPAGAAVRQPVRRDHAALLQHARLQVLRRVLPRGGSARRAGAGLCGQRAVHRLGVVAARRAAERARPGVRRAGRRGLVRRQDQARAQRAPAAGGGAAGVSASVRGAALRGRGVVRRGRLPGGQPRRRARRAAARLRLAHLRVRLRHAPVRRRAQDARRAARAARRSGLLPCVPDGGAGLDVHAGLPHAPRQPAAHAGARAPALRALPARQLRRDGHAVRARHRRQAGSSAADPGDHPTDGERVPAPDAISCVRHPLPRAVAARIAGGGGARRGGGGGRGVRRRAARRGGCGRAPRALLARRSGVGARQAARVPQRGHATGAGAHAPRAPPRRRRAHPARVAAAPRAAPRSPHPRPRPRAAAPAGAHRRYASAGRGGRQVRGGRGEARVLAVRAGPGTAAAAAASARLHGGGRREAGLPAAARGVRRLGGGGRCGAAARRGRRARCGRRPAWTRRRADRQPHCVRAAPRAVAPPRTAAAAPAARAPRAAAAAARAPPLCHRMTVDHSVTSYRRTMSAVHKRHATHNESFCGLHVKIKLL